MREALLYERKENNFVHCFLCSHHCLISEGKFGACGVRQNVAGRLFSNVYARPVAMHVDPVEKKPLYHFLCGSASFSIATLGCNFRCGFCQNWQISQIKSAPDQKALLREVAPLEVVESAIKKNCRSISYTYTEPTIFFEYAYDIAKLAKDRGLRNIFVTNGYMTRECLRMIGPYLDAANVDLKFFKDSSYKEFCAGRLKPVLDSIKAMKDAGIWIEITTLVIPGLNDSEEELRDIATFISGIDKNIPWHVSRFHPDYQFDGYSSTPENSLKKALGQAQKAGLKFVYAGNVRDFGNDTSCPACGRLLIKREVFSILEYNIKEGKCPSCRKAIPGIF